MKYVVGSSIGVKAAGGIRSKEEAEAMIASGLIELGLVPALK